MSFRPILYEPVQSDKGVRYLGFIAEELEAACKYAVVYNKEDGKLSGIDYSRLVVILTKELQDLKSQVAKLSERG